MLYFNHSTVTFIRLLEHLTGKAVPMDIKKAALNTSPCDLDRIGVYAALGFDPDCYPWDYPVVESDLFLNDNKLDRYGVGVYGMNEYRIIEIPDFLIDDDKTVEAAFKALTNADEIKKHAKALYDIEYSQVSSYQNVA